MPKSSSLTWPSAVTRMLPGFRSRCSTSRWCACATAASTSRNRRRRCSTRRARVAPAIDGLAVDVLEHQVGLAAVGSLRRRAGAAMFGCDRRPRSRRLASEAGGAAARPASRVRQLDGGHAFEATVASPRQPDAAHPAVRRARAPACTRQRDCRSLHRRSAHAARCLRENPRAGWTRCWRAAPPAFRRARRQPRADRSVGLPAPPRRAPATRRATDSGGTSARNREGALGKSRGSMTVNRIRRPGTDMPPLSRRRANVAEKAAPCPSASARCAR